ncbi:MAG TPA: hypothetical protein VIE12_04575 [Actinomycetota bacterium]
MNVQDLVSFRAHFERFPASVKGAFVLRAADGDPHQVRIAVARVREVAGSAGRPIDVEPVTLDVAPNLDTFVPFEFALTELTAGWYTLECEVAIDGSPTTVRPGQRFSVPWPRATVRRGQIPVNETVQVQGGTKARLELLECAGDSSTLRYAATEPVDVRLFADGARVPVLESAFDEAQGRGSVTAYPLLKSQGAVTIDVRGGPAPVEIPLP